MGLNLKSTSSKVLASAALLAAAAGVAGMGTYGAFTATTTASTDVKAATVRLTAGDGNVAFAAEGLIPGDSMQRTFVLANGGDQDLTNVVLTTSASPTSLLTTGANGLVMTIDSCPSAWTPTSAGSNVYTCSSPTTVLKQQQVAGVSKTPLTSLASLKAKGTDNLRITMALPGDADNAYQGLRSTVSLQFDAAARSRADK
jgi:hypothetical protein